MEALFPAHWWWLLLDLAIAAFIGAFALQYLSDPVTALIGLVMAAVVLLRRRRPVLTMAVVSALAVVQLLVVRDLTPYDIAVLVAMAAVITHSSLRDAYVAGAVMAAGLVLAWFTVETKVDDPVVLGLVVALCAVVWLVSLVLRQRKDTASAYADRAATAERERDHLVRLAAATERAAIARELHDVVAHSLAVMIVQADGATFVVDSDSAKAKEALRTIGDIGRDALEDMHRIVAVLRTGDEDPTRRTGLDQLEVLAERARSAGVGVRLRVAVDGIGAAEELTVVRLVQEGLTNVLRHAGPGASAEIDVRADETGVELSITDDGAGTAVGSTSGGNGLVGMRERVLLHSGQFSAGPVAGSGWRVHAVVPRRAKQV
ncbi:Signal transduction histidine kinase [Lentzea xinjiangensis]|uniref:histidine kinase n=1 Tax=Lentzea xinjiangensis TaxID=402600 RepID=A0A1H9NLA1_9PSEU|nr:histidine kinase [Lentzea xinjiangensis]SER36672.1 Signal transduction histidine kinase [Lentzea xinjiangensis]